MYAMEKEMEFVDPNIVKVEEDDPLSPGEIRNPADNNEPEETKHSSPASDLSTDNPRADNKNSGLDRLALDDSVEKNHSTMDTERTRPDLDSLIGGQARQGKIPTADSDEDLPADKETTAGDEASQAPKRSAAAVTGNAKRSRTSSRPPGEPRESNRVPMELQKSLREFYERGGRDYNEYLNWLKTMRTFQNSHVYSYEDSRRDVGSPQIYTPPDRLRPAGQLLGLLSKGHPEDAMCGPQHGQTNNNRSPGSVSTDDQSSIPSLEYIDERNFTVLDLSQRKQVPPLSASKRLQELLLAHPANDAPTRPRPGDHTFDPVIDDLGRERRYMTGRCTSASPELNTRTENGRPSPKSPNTAPENGMEFRTPHAARSLKTNGEGGREYHLDGPVYHNPKSSAEAASAMNQPWQNGDRPHRTAINTFTVHHQPSVHKVTNASHGRPNGANRGIPPKKTSVTENHKEVLSKSAEPTSVWPFLEEIIVRSLARSPPCRSIKDVTSRKSNRQADPSGRKTQGDRQPPNSLGPYGQGRDMSEELESRESDATLATSPDLKRQAGRVPQYTHSPSPRLPAEGGSLQSSPTTSVSVPSPYECSSASDLDLLSWDVDQVVHFVTDIPRCQDYAEVFRAQEIDGLALSQLNEDHLVRFFSMKLGPAIRLKLAVVAKLKDFQR